MTEATKRKIAATKRGSKHTEETKRKIALSVMIYRQGKRRAV